MMAHAWAIVTGQPSVCLVTAGPARGPGASGRWG
jgi:thiamine pyrophosphate-dependent acetolactate synthase large subunit-like protein